MNLTMSVTARVNDESTHTIAKLSDEGGRKTVEFFRVLGMDAGKGEWIASALNDATQEPVRFPLMADFLPSGLPAHMACETPQQAWQFAAMHGHKVKAMVSEPATIAALTSPARDNE